VLNVISGVVMNIFSNLSMIWRVEKLHPSFVQTRVPSIVSDELISWGKTRLDTEQNDPVPQTVEQQPSNQIAI
jgi:hypothetical protein